MTEEPSLDITKTYAAILEAARRRRFVSYGALAKASGVPWARARHPLFQQLGRLVKIGHDRGWPLLSAIVVNDGDVDTGALRDTTLQGFLAAARSVGLDVADPKALVKEQQRKLFDWAPTAPDTLDLDDADIPPPKRGGPRLAGKYGDDPDEEEVPFYTLDNILDDGSFLPRAFLETILGRLVDKKNVILQGPPGTGKTWLAKRLGYALIDTRDRKAIQQRLRIVQFHPSLSYEDFVRGWRPERSGGPP
jgi:hypothetical protein